MKQLLAVLLLAMNLAFAGEAVPLADDPQLEARVQRLSEELRCLVCQNQTIADSHAGLAQDLKNQIREQLRAGKSDDDILAYMTERYGDFVLYRPPVKATTLLLWVGPFLLLGVGAIVTVVAVRRRKPRVDSCEFTGEDHARAAALLAGTPETTK
ncbi:cytochrome c-type biogenesis protein [Ramlibacter albus]|uniref:Cytochrome c-type biogenesis protein n=1 Tax=Ramlibacter albus TaxID=2079448 RepID=A0A923M7A6_9BURK|nr:cytochrome c-type biogenesis protein [Ramlibacter albus]MBC5764039.1 cytochrome c-type biogenesis protein CcmH [Ramlibacter albus]